MRPPSSASFTAVDFCQNYLIPFNSAGFWPFIKHSVKVQKSDAGLQVDEMMTRCEFIVLKQLIN